MASLNITVIYGSVRPKRQGIKAARFIVNKLKERNHKVTLIDPLEYRLHILTMMYKEYPKGKAPKILEKLAKIYKSADAFIFVSAEYNHTVPPALKNEIDHFLEEWFHRPSAIVTYSSGPWGGTIAAAHLRSILGEIGTVSIPSMFHIPRVQEAFDEKGNATDTNYNRRIIKFLDELEWYSKALKEARKKGVPY